MHLVGIGVSGADYVARVRKRASTSWESTLERFVPRLFLEIVEKVMLRRRFGPGIPLDRQLSGGQRRLVLRFARRRRRNSYGRRLSRDREYSAPNLRPRGRLSLPCPVAGRRAHAAFQGLGQSEQTRTGRSSGRFGPRKERFPQHCPTAARIGASRSGSGADRNACLQSVPHS